MTLYLGQGDLEKMKTEYGWHGPVHDHFVPLVRTCSIQTKFDRCPNKAAHQLVDEDGDPTGDLVCEQCRPMVEHLIACGRTRLSRLRLLPL